MFRKITQQKLSDSIDVALRTYQCYEQGVREPSFATLIKIADVLDVSTDYLLGRDEYLKSHGAFFDEFL
ncbi:helix-turn-helix domain-containing protein [Eubacterium maltosivorans]|uniref:helix-turn-helix domain-containing protein n=1 Tax=Eubacterium maltosivorans TaxID=2041044 RepID=UPI003A92E728